MNNEPVSYSNKGLSQESRLLNALLPGAFRIDGRTTEDLVAFMADLATQVHFYNSNNEIDGDWEGFFTSDIYLLAAVTARMDIDQLAGGECDVSEPDFAENENHLVQQVSARVNRLLKACLALQKRQNQFGNTSFDHDRAGRFRDILSPLPATVADLHRVIIALSAIPQVKYRINQLWASRLFAGMTPVNNTTGNTIPDHAAIQTRMQDAFSSLHRMQAQVRIVFNQLKAHAGNFLKIHPLSDQEYPAHLGMIMTFLHLYHHLQDAVNGLTRKHLDFYYKKILGIPTAPAIPDKVHIVAELMDHFHPVVLERGEKLVAKVKEEELPVEYQLDQSFPLGAAKISRLRTLFISEPEVFSGEHDRDVVKDAQVFTGEYPVLQPAALLKPGAAYSSWPVLGEEEAKLPEQKQMMLAADTGLLVGSPLLYLPEGVRTIRVIFFFDPTSFFHFAEYVRVFALHAEKTEDGVLNDILPPAFTISYTGEEGWVTAKKHSLSRFEGDANSILLEVKLDSTDAPVSVYQPALHGGSYDTDLPLLKLMLNNDSSHNAFSFFKELLIEKITVYAEVAGFKAVSLRNNTGRLSTENPFHPFGPLPSTGSFLDIRNTNVFNRYTRHFSVTLYWQDLPAIPRGFDAYYAAYDKGITNHSFRVALSAAAGGHFLPAVERQEFALFSLGSNEYEPPVLNDRTRIDKVNFRKIVFSCDPALAAEDDKTDTDFSDGAIRIELVSPDDAFGHQLYNKLLPETILHNAKFYRRKRPLPEQPYTPVVRSVSLSYKLEHTEVLRGSVQPRQKKNRLELIHLYPGGYERIYPGPGRQAYTLLPVFDAKYNLYIGFSRLIPGQELSLLFQLEEKIFHHTLHEPVAVTWSYLQDNTWLPFSADEILADATTRFVNTGIVRLQVPRHINTEHTIMEKDMYWIRASATGTHDVRGRVIGIFVNAGLASRVSAVRATAKDGFYLSPGSVSGFSRKIKEVAAVIQPFSSFSGRDPETISRYYVRVSERLRHKQRPVTPRDIEQFVLQHFPEILMAKCIGVARKEQAIAAGTNVQVIVIPRANPASDIVATEQPGVSLATLYRIKLFLAGQVSPFIKIEVGNPVYEKVKLSFGVKLAKAKINDDTGLAIRALHEDIRRYFCPWLFESGKNVRMGERIYMTDLINYLKRISYVESITGFSLAHFYKTKGKAAGEMKSGIIDSSAGATGFIQATVPEAVLIPSRTHLIRVLDAAHYDEPSPMGINSLIIGHELLVTGTNKGQEENEKPMRDTEEYFNIIINQHTA